MVGVPSSNKCENCRKRKKKCGEQHPSCAECIQAGWSCPGYKPLLKFVDENKQLAKHYSERKFTYDTVDPSLDANYSAILSSNDASERNRRKLEWTYVYFRLINPDIPRYRETNVLGSALVYCMNSKVSRKLIPLRTVGTFFEFIPERLGHNTALDDAVACLCAIYSGECLSSYTIQKNAYKRYVKALASLRRCLEDEVVRLEPETLCASILLQMCELLISIDRGEWNQLSLGTMFLLKSRGVDRYKAPFDNAMLESQQGYILAQSVRTRTPSFLSLPEWQDVLVQDQASFQSETARTLGIRSRLFGALIHLPTLIAGCESVDTKNSDWEDEVHLLARDALTLFEKMKDLIAIRGDSPFKSSHISNRPLRMETEYPDIIPAVVDCIANIAVLSINQVFRSLYSISLPSSSLTTMTTELPLDSETLVYCRQRGLKAFEYVRSLSELAAKPLEFGIQQFRGDPHH